MSRIWMVIVLVAGIGPLLGWNALSAWQRSLIFPAPDGVRDVADTGLPGLVSWTVTAADGTPIDVWRDGQAGMRPTVLLFHGNGEANADFGPRMLRARKAGFAVAAMEYRGYNGAPGTPSETALIADADRVMAALAAEGTGPDRIVLWGYSIGAAVAVQMGARHRVRGIVLEAPFLSLLALAEDRFPGLPVAWFLRDPFLSADVAPTIRSPALVLSGSIDDVVPAEHGRRLAELIPGANFHRIAGAGHANLADFDEETSAIDAFLASLASSPSAPP